MRKSTYFRLTRQIARYLRSLGVCWYRTYSDKRIGGRYRTKFVRLSGMSPEAMTLLASKFGGRNVRIELSQSINQQYGGRYVSLLITPVGRLRAV